MRKRAGELPGLDQLTAWSSLLLVQKLVALELCFLLQERITLILKDLRVDVVLVRLPDHSIVPLDRVLQLLKPLFFGSRKIALTLGFPDILVALSLIGRFLRIDLPLLRHRELVLPMPVDRVASFFQARKCRSRGRGSSRGYRLCLRLMVYRGQLTYRSTLLCLLLFDLVVCVLHGRASYDAHGAKDEREEDQSAEPDGDERRNQQSETAINLVRAHRHDRSDQRHAEEGVPEREPPGDGKS